MAELSEAAARLDDPPRAQRLYDRLIPYADRSLCSGRAVFTYGSAEHYLGRLAATLGEVERAEAHYAAALRA